MKTKVLLVRILEDEDFVYQAENLSLQKRTRRAREKIVQKVKKNFAFFSRCLVSSKVGDYRVGANDS